jgi:hypothetical protein
MNVCVCHPYAYLSRIWILFLLCSFRKEVLADADQRMLETKDRIRTTTNKQRTKQKMKQPYYTILYELAVG